MAIQAILLLAAAAPCALAQNVDVSVRVEINRQASQASRLGSSEVVVWLTSLQKTDANAALAKDYTLLQKDKEFVPHILVVPVGSSVDFPNLDPFFHNVFSLFNGKRFDLGLYEGHTHRTVQFDREGVSYIFCNIHPNMGAVVVSVGTPYFGLSSSDGTVILRGVPAGRYRLNVWAENVPTDRLSQLSRVVEINPENSQLGLLRLKTSGDMMRHHQNKFGEAYKPAPRQSY